MAMSNQSAPVFLTVAEVAELLRESTATIRRFCRMGLVPAVRVGLHWRIRREELEEQLTPKGVSDGYG